MRPPRRLSARAALCALLLGVGGCGLGRALVAFQVDEAANEVRLERRLQELWYETLDRFPEQAAHAGEHKDATRWDPLPGSDAARAAALIVDESILRLEDDFAPRGLDARSARLMTRARVELARQRDRLVDEASVTPHPWRGAAATAPAFLAHLQPTGDAEDLRRWTRRLVALSDVVRAEAARARAGAGAARLPRSLLDRTLEALRPLAGAAPDNEHPLLSPFERRATVLPRATADVLMREARAAVRDRVRPAYGELVEALETVRARAPETAGAGRTPALEAAWRETLASLAGRDREPLVLHELGRAQVQRLRDALAALAPNGAPLGPWFDALRDDPDRAAAAARPPLELWSDVRVRLPELVGDVSAPAPEVRRADPWERAERRWSPLVPAAPDGGRQAILLVTPATRDRTPAWWREAEALRQGLPGRALFDHLVARADIPDLLARAEQPAHAEGWSLWLTLAALDEGIVPMDDRGFTRLATELVHAAVLVADTGLHGRAWTLGQTVDYLRAVTPLPGGACELLAARIAAEPGRAAAPFLGLVQLRAIERQAELTLGPYLDRTALRVALVDEGPLGPEDLEERAARWIRAQSSAR